MRPNTLHPAQVVDIVGAGAKSHPAVRAELLATAAAGPGIDVASLTLGQRERLLLALRQLTFGDSWRGRVRCPECRGDLAVILDGAELMAGRGSGKDGSGETSFVAGDLLVRIRQPDLGDLASASRAGSHESARAALVESCVSAHGPDGAVPPSQLPPEVVAAAGKALVDEDPFVELQVQPTCAACGATWPCLLDVATWLWAEFAAAAERLLDDVHCLARAYGWPEDEILALPSDRRAAYVERVASA